MPSPPALVYATPQEDLVTGNDLWGLVVDQSELERLGVERCALIFHRESAFDAVSGQVDQEATAILLANNSLHYGRTADIEWFSVFYGEDRRVPIGVSFESFAARQTWHRGDGPTIEIPRLVPVLGGRRIATYRDDHPFDAAADPRVIVDDGRLILPWEHLEPVSGGSPLRRLYVATPNHLLSSVNQNPNLPHVDQVVGAQRFQTCVFLPEPARQGVEDCVRAIPDESSPVIRRAVKGAAQLLFKRDWLF